MICAECAEITMRCTNQRLIPIPGIAVSLPKILFVLFCSFNKKNLFGFHFGTSKHQFC